MSRIIFKQCPMCAAVWESREIFLRDHSLMMNGYQADFFDLEQGLFHFTHKIEGCGTTLVVEAGEFFDLNPRERFQERKTDTEECPGYCLRKTEFDPCLAKCECAFVRDLITIINHYKDQQ